MKKLILLLMLYCGGTFAQSPVKTDPAVLRQFMDMRFGMFVHWGPVSLRGTEIGWSRGDQVPTAEYDNLYKEFNPVLFNADEWVKAAKDAGMKYLTITARHHDGFCLWPSAFTEYDIASTPYKKDIVGALAAACKKQGIRFCIYYTVLDWWHPDYPVNSPKDQTIDPKADMNRYMTYMKNQLKELVTKYDPYMLWFDGQWEQPWTDERGREIYAYLKQLNPKLITNNRLGKEFAAMENKQVDISKMVGDYDTPEQVVGKMNMDFPWESCFTICNQWAWKPNDKMKSLETCLDILARTAGGNGNLLLNVGPMPDGRIEARQTDRLREIGNWLKTNGAAIYGTMGGPWAPNDNFSATRKGDKVFIHVLKSNNGELTMKALPGRAVRKSTVLGGGAVTTETANGELRIKIPQQPATLPYVIELTLDGPAEQLPIL
ncbi:alpha-L-fucosidase [Chitinophaga rhizosphaerae]|uniref:alpha-L-fucosidase n=1 Tax=Chitinophaga rhizosphaerae TaxID=1864947 RepID=UPI000F807332|nr:alpha-L-fucosidase [Chitinophaga rhizosphaerae]